jgi:hypothetical protein
LLKVFLKELQIFEEFNIPFLGGAVKEPGTSVIVDFMGVIKGFFFTVRAETRSCHVFQLRRKRKPQRLRAEYFRDILLLLTITNFLTS